MNNALISKIRSYFKTQPIEKAWLFGSFSRGEETDKSDIDLMVEFTKGVRVGLSYFRMIGDLENLCRRKIDLAESSMIDERVRTHVDKDKILIYERTF